ncbi:MAG: caspase family protein [Myxococcales bacterium]|nr:caspase family protein [Myxococcales bacterium]
MRFSDPSLAGFRVEDRRDVELGRVLVASGVPAAQVTTLLDERATRAAVLEAVGRAADATPRGGTLLFYYAGHGIRTRQGDIAYVAYDTLGSDASRPGISVEDLFAVLAPRVVGKRVVLLGDCCHSGGLGDLAARLGTLGITALSLTSADASNLSTGNWTYSQLLLEGLRGDAALDGDADGEVDLAELEQGVRAAMRYRERQLSGANLTRVEPTRVRVAVRQGGARAGAQAGQFMRDRHGHVVRVNRVDGPSATVRRYDYALSHDALVPVADLSPITTTRYPVGTQLMVEWGGREWPAVVTDQQGDFAFITYPGWPHYWDEWILDDRVRRVVAPAP